MVTRWCIFAVLLGFAAACAGQPPVLPTGPSLNLARQMEIVRLSQWPGDPQRTWDGKGAEPVKAGEYLRLRPGQVVVGRATLQGAGSYVIEVPIVSLDEVQVWQREPGGEWQSRLAGDRVPMFRWPFRNQFPAFPVVLGAQPLDLMIAVRNSGAMRVPLTLTADAQVREYGVRRASLSGVMLGLGVMTALVCLLGATLMRVPARWLLAGVTVWMLLTIAANNGYLAFWLIGDWPRFNDSVKHFTGMVMGGLFVLLVAQVLDPLTVHPGERRLALAAVPLALTYAAAQAFWLPYSWRLSSAAAAAMLCILASVALCVASAVRGGRHAGWVAAGTGCLTAAIALGFLPLHLVSGVDLRAAAMAILMYSSVLLVRHALQLRERYGRDVLSRAAVSAYRDPLTALWSYEGFQQRYAEAALRDAAGQGSASMMLFLLPGLGRTDAQHGTVLTERALVRFAATLQAAMGRRWSIARLSHNRFAAVSLDAPPAAELVHIATRALSHCARQSQPVDLVAEFDLRIACRHGRIDPAALVDALREMELAGRSLRDGKRITLL